VGYYYPSGLEKTLYKCDIYVTLVTKGLRQVSLCNIAVLLVGRSVRIKEFTVKGTKIKICIIFLHFNKSKL
jgi:hypothetical protein